MLHRILIPLKQSTKNYNRNTNTKKKKIIRKTAVKVKIFHKLALQTKEDKRYREIYVNSDNKQRGISNQILP